MWQSVDCKVGGLGFAALLGDVAALLGDFAALLGDFVINYPNSLTQTLFAGISSIHLPWFVGYRWVFPGRCL